MSEAKIPHEGFMHDRLMSLAATLAATSMLLQLAVAALKTQGLPDMAREAILNSLGKHAKSINASADAAAMLAHLRETNLSDVIDWADSIISADQHGAIATTVERDVARAVISATGLAGGSDGKAH